jgi:hypothetical protein
LGGIGRTQPQIDDFNHSGVGGKLNHFGPVLHATRAGFLTVADMQDEKIVMNAGPAGAAEPGKPAMAAFDRFHNQPVALRTLNTRKIRAGQAG